MYKYNIKASEELNQGGFDFELVEGYHCIKIGATNVAQLKKAGILPPNDYKGLSKNKPDGLIIKDKNTVVCLIEYKNTGKFANETEALATISNWYYSLAKKLSCNVICASDGVNSYWFHSTSKQHIKNPDGKCINFVLNVADITNKQCMSTESKAALVELLKKSDNLDSNAQIAPEIILNPQTLANSVWQKIWISTGKEPEKCLYNVVEIFIFKFLSDLGVLKDHYSFDNIYNTSTADKEDALKQYAALVRPKIREMFPKSPLDNTTVINGTIFVNEEGQPNLAQATLFQTVLQQFADYDKEYGSFKNIDKSFKTRLYESFLRQSAGISSLGQYFTPRNVVKAIVRMAQAESLPDNAVVCDPFCGVGGFLLEFLNEYPKFKQQYEPINGKITPKLKLEGYDKGSDEKDDQRTIILAKANMLIYLSDLIAKHKSDTKEFAESVFNQVFHLIKTNLGTFGIDKKETFDLILTNPPYVTSGVSAMKKEIEENGKSCLYPISGNGLEGLALEWIINSLKQGGRAFIIVPDGLLSRSADNKLREHLLTTCTLNAIISLPTRTFFATPKNTYILSISKKSDREHQTTPIFTYLVSEIGETRDAKRFEIANNDLYEMTKLYKQFMASPSDFESNSQRCKVFPLARFINSHWLVDRDWSDEEKMTLGILEESTTISEQEFISIIHDVSNLLNSFTKNGL